MATLTETARTGEFIVSEANGTLAREQITLSGAAALVAGTVLGAVNTGVPTVTAGTPVSGSGGTVGDGSIGTVTADAGAPAGEYRVEIINPATNLGNFRVLKPDGTVDGVGTVGTAYNGTVNFTLADGTADWVEDDFIPITVEYLDAETTLVYELHDPAGTDGSEIAAGILYAAADPSAANVTAVAFVGPGEVNRNLLTWKAAITADQKELGYQQLAALGIKTRA